MSLRLLKVAIATLFFVSTSIVIALLRVARRPIPARFVVLAYHSIKRHERERFARQMDRLVHAAKPVTADFAADTHERNTVYAAVTFDDGYHSVLENAIPVLAERRIPATLFVPTEYLGGPPAWIRSASHRNASERLLTRNELLCLRKKGVAIGSHSATHKDLTRLSHAEAFTELAKSRQTLEDILGEKVSSFALPYGSENADVLRLARRAGYERVFLSVPRGIGRASNDYLVGRIDVTPTDWPVEYHLKIHGAYQWLPLAITAKRCVRSALQKLSWDR